MNNSNIKNIFDNLSTALIADTCVKLQIPIRYGPSSIVPLLKESKIAGNLTPVKHNGSVSSFFEAIENSESGNILYIDNQGRTDEAVIGDLTVLEVKQAGLSGIIVWGFHRDTKDIKKINFPVFSTGCLPFGPRRTETISNEDKSVFLGIFEVFSSDTIFADEDGIVVISSNLVEDVLNQAKGIYTTERKQVAKLQTGLSLRKQFHFDDYLLVKKSKQHYTFREHLRQLGKEIEQ